jgi:hypothetical protein
VNTNYDHLLENLKAMAASLTALQAQAVKEYTAVVEQLVATRSRDASRIEHTLDRLLDVACHPEGLTLFKSLCRHYYGFDPAAAADYVRFYREMWDRPDDKEDRS